jgi:hypothetical protein
VANNVKYGNDVGDLLTAVENAISYASDAMDELNGLGELKDLHDMLQDYIDEAKKMKDELESYMSGEYKAQQDEIMREYHRSVI